MMCNRIAFFKLIGAVKSVHAYEHVLQCNKYFADVTSMLQSSKRTKFLL